MIDGDLFYIGGYTAASGGRADGVTLAGYATGADAPRGALAAVGVVARTDSPSFLTRHPELPVLYAANELADGSVTAWRIASDGRLSSLGSRPTGGADPCHLAVSPDGGYLATANYSGGSVAVHPLDAAGAPGERTDLVRHTGHGPHRERQEAAHAHMVRWEGAGRLRVVDLGTDSVLRYEVRDGRLHQAGEPLRTPPGSGPRHFATTAGGWCYVAAELSGSVIAYHSGPDTDGYVERARVPATTRPGPVQPSEIAVSADGRFLYLANRGPDTIAVFALDRGLPRYLTEVACGGRWPRHFLLDGDLLQVVNERSHTVVTFHIPAADGVPVPTGAVLETPSPTCVIAVPRAAVS